MTFYRISELRVMLATLIWRYDKKKSFHCINSIYQFIKPFLDNRTSVFEEYGAFKYLKLQHCSLPSANNVKGTIRASSREQSSLNFPSNQSFSAHAQPFIRPTCQVLWVKVPNGLPLNSGQISSSIIQEGGLRSIKFVNIPHNIHIVL